MAQIHKAEAIVLKKRQLLQQDFVITLFTKELGKIKVIAKGIKKLTSRRAPHLETGNLLNIILSQKSEPHYLQQTELISAFSGIKDHTDKMSYAYVYFFILDRILPEGQTEESLFNITKKFLIDLTKLEEISILFLQKYLQKMLMYLGYVHEERSFAELIHITEEIIHEKVPLHAII